MGNKYSTREVHTSENIRAKGLMSGAVELWRERSAGDTYGHPARVDRKEMVALGLIAEDQKDIDLGRWRSEVKNWMVVYKVGGDTNRIRVVDERDGQSLQFTRSEKINIEDGDFSYTAQAYWNAHKEPGVWESAKHGEVWVLSRSDGSKAAFTMDRSEPDVHPAGVWRNLETYMAGNSDSIRFGKRIYYPEGV